MRWRFVRRDWGGWLVLGPAGHAGAVVRVPVALPGGVREVKLGAELWQEGGRRDEAAYRIVWS